MAAAPDPRGHPAWYGAVMGTGALALAVAAQEPVWAWSWLGWLSVALLWLASALALVLLPRYVRRVGDRARLRHEIADAAHGPMLATLPAGLLVVAVGWGRIGPDAVPAGVARGIAIALLVAGVLIATALGLAWSASVLTASHGLEGVNGGWLIPPVMNLLVPLALAPLIVEFPVAAPLLVLVGFAFLGVGFVIFMAVLTLLIARLALRDPLPAAMAPSLWIPLAPAGIIGLSTLRLLQAAEAAGVSGFTGIAAGLVVSAMGLGFGLWWAGFAALELQRIRRSGGPPVHPGWWGFVFPVGAMTLSLTAVGGASGVRSIQVLGLVATVGLAALWGYVAITTAPLARRRSP